MKNYEEDEKGCKRTKRMKMTNRMKNYKKDEEDEKGMKRTLKDEKGRKG